MYDPSMLIWLDETGCDGRNTICKYGYSIRGMPLSDHRLLVQGVRYSAIPIMSMEGIHQGCSLVVSWLPGNPSGSQIQ